MSLLKRPVVLFLGACFVCIVLIYHQSHKHYEGQCNIDVINTVVMDQDDPCIQKVIRASFLHTPSKEKLNLKSPAVENPSMGQSQVILKLLENKRNGFFVECGALDGETRSNTLYMEQQLGWDGVLIEADPQNFEKLLAKHRRAWSVPSCLSTATSPKTVIFKQNFNQGRISQNQEENLVHGNVQVQCFPIFSILAALNRTTVDYFSLDIEGDELAVLKTIPWSTVHIQTLSVEFIHDKEGKVEILEYMTQQGYEMVQEVTDPNWLANDFIFNKISQLHNFASRMYAYYV